MVENRMRYFWFFFDWSSGHQPTYGVIWEESFYQKNGRSARRVHRMGVNKVDDWNCRKKWFILRVTKEVMVRIYLERTIRLILPKTRLLSLLPLCLELPELYEYAEVWEDPRPVPEDGEELGWCTCDQICLFRSQASWGSCVGAKSEKADGVFDALKKEIEDMTTIKCYVNVDLRTEARTDDKVWSCCYSTVSDSRGLLMEEGKYKPALYRSWRFADFEKENPTFGVYRTSNLPTLVSKKRKRTNSIGKTSPWDTIRRSIQIQKNKSTQALENRYRHSLQNVHQKQSTRANVDYRRPAEELRQHWTKKNKGK